MKTGDLVCSMWKDTFVFEMDDKLHQGGRMITGRGPFIYLGDVGGQLTIILLPNGKIMYTRASELKVIK